MVVGSQGSQGQAAVAAAHPRSRISHKHASECSPLSRPHRDAVWPAIMPASDPRAQGGCLPPSGAPRSPLNNERSWWINSPLSFARNGRRSYDDSERAEANVVRSKGGTASFTMAANSLTWNARKKGDRAGHRSCSKEDAKRSSSAKRATCLFIRKNQMHKVLEETAVGESDDTGRVTSGSEEGDRRRAALQKRADFLFYVRHSAPQRSVWHLFSGLVQMRLHQGRNGDIWLSEQAIPCFGLFPGSAWEPAMSPRGFPPVCWPLGPLVSRDADPAAGPPQRFARPSFSGSTILMSSFFLLSRCSMEVRIRALAMESSHKYLPGTPVHCCYSHHHGSGHASQRSFLLAHHPTCSAPKSSNGYFFQYIVLQ